MAQQIRTWRGVTAGAIAIGLVAGAVGAVQGQSAPAPVNDAPNPYTTVENHFKLPEGRTWGSTSAVDIDKDGKSIWVGERCGANTCWDRTKNAMSPLPVILKFDESGKLPKGDKTTFKEMANGVPGLQVRLPLLFSEGVAKKRISLQEFVALTAANHAKMYGLYPRKGTIEVGADADIAIWEPEKRVTLTAAMMKDNVGYTPYEGMTVTGWPTTVLSRGRIAVSNEKLQVERGTGQFIPRGVPAPVAAAKLRDGPAAILRKLIG